MNIICGVDVGSVRCGLVAATEGLPLRIHAAGVVPVPAFERGRRLDVQPAVDALVQRIVACGATRVIIEHALFYSPAGMSSQKAAKLAQNHEICSHIEAGVHRELTALGGVEVITIPRARWAHRVVPHTSGGITDAMANEGMQQHIEAAAWEKWLCGGDHEQDRRDAAGVVVGYLLPAPRKARKRRAGGPATAAPPAPRKTPEQRREAATARLMRHRAKASPFAGMSLQELEAKGCVCFQGRARRGGRHRAGCPAAPTTRRKPKAIDPLDVALGLEPDRD